MVNTKIEKSGLKDKLLAEFKTFEKHLNSSSSNALHDLRKDALKHFKELGFPNRKDEEWKYTNIDPITKLDFHQEFSTNATGLTEKEIKKFFIPGLNTIIAVLVNGKYSDNLSNIKNDSNNIFVSSLKEAQKNHPVIFDTHFAKYADFKTNGFTALNTAFTYDGIFIYVPGGNKIVEPIIILNISETKKPNILLQPRNLIISGKNSAVTLIELNYTIGNNHSFNNTVTEIFVDKNSVLNLYKIQNEGDKNFYIGTTQIHQEKDSKFDSATISWGGSITRNNLNSLLNGEGCECNFDGAFVLSNNQHVDNHTLVDHVVPNCQSNEFYKGILDNNSVGVFNGKIIVRKDAQETNAYQSNKNILLTKTAVMNSKPQLEIFADDVRCSHGATTGQLKEDELFYLRTRGIDKEEARITLLFAFASEIIQRIKIVPLRNILFDMLHKKLKKGS